jgi:hypothetical protein
MITKRIFSPKGFGFWAVELKSLFEVTWLGEGVSGLSPEQRKSARQGLKFATEDEILGNKPIQAHGKSAADIGYNRHLEIMLIASYDEQKRDCCGWETGIRTPIKWSRATRPTVRRSPSTAGGFYLRETVV